MLYSRCFAIATDHTDLRTALELADDAANVAMDFFERGVEPEIKSDGSPVTEADRDVERLIRTRLAEEFPAARILAEELGGADKGDRIWIIDPIDGTSSFVDEKPDWRIQLALVADEEVVVAVVVAPALQKLWWARHGHGAFESSWPHSESVQRRMQVSSTTSRSESIVEAYPQTPITRQLPDWEIHPVGTVDPLQRVVPIQVLCGNSEAFIFRGCAAWDHAPWILLIEEAGGKFTDWSGGTTPFKQGGVYSNAHVHDRLVSGLDIG